MGKFSKQMKNRITGIINDMADHAELFSENPGHDFTRERSLDFRTMVSLIMSIGGNSLTKELYDFAKNGGKEVTPSAFVQQRDKISDETFAYLLYEFNSQCSDTALFAGRYRLLAVDGTVCTYSGYDTDDTYMPNTGNGVNQYHVNALYDLMNRTYTDAIIQPNPQANEQKACWQMAEKTKSSEQVIIIGDRGYGGMNLIEHLNRIENVDYLFRIKDHLWKEMCDLPMTNLDVDITLKIRTTQTNADKKAFANGEAKWMPGRGKRTKLKSPAWDFEASCEIPVRIVRFKITDDSYETIATSLPRNEFPPALLRQMYFMRWGIETSFRELKYAIGLTSFHARKAKFIRQEILARIVMYNFCERIMAKVVIHVGKRKHTYQINYTMGFYVCRLYFRGMNTDDPELEIAKYILPVRPGRADRRKAIIKKGAVCFSYRVA